MPAKARVFSLWAVASRAGRISPGRFSSDAIGIREGGVALQIGSQKNVCGQRRIELSESRMDGRAPTDGSSTVGNSGTSAPRRLEWLDALRGWAVFAVVAVHSGEAAHSTGIVSKVVFAGQYGVQLFFLVSALTISITYDSHIERYGKSAMSQLSWLTKRFFRIAPLYYIAALFYPAEKYVVYVLSHHRYGWELNPLNILANLLFIHTWVPSANNSVVPGGWSIGVEMFFYALVPLIWLVVPTRRRAVYLCIGAGTCLLATFLVSKAFTGSFYVPNSSYLYYWFPSQAPVILFGLVFYFNYRAKLGSPTKLRTAASCFAGFLVLLVLALYCGTGGEAAPVLAPTILGVAFILLVLSLHAGIKSLVVSRFAVFLGKISYSVYIVHFLVLELILVVIRAAHIDRSGPLVVVPIFVLALVLASGLALISKRVIEDPAIACGHRLCHRLALRAIATEAARQPSNEHDERVSAGPS